MAQIVLTDTIDAPRQQVWAAISDLDHSFSDAFTCKRLDKKAGKGARRQLTIAGFEMTDEVLAINKGQDLTFGATEFKDAPFRHFVTTYRLAGPEKGPTSVALAVDFAGGFAGLRAKGKVQRAFQELLDGLGAAAQQEPETIEVTA